MASLDNDSVNSADFKTFFDLLSKYQEQREAALGVKNMSPWPPNQTKGSLSAYIAHRIVKAAEQFHAPDVTQYSDFGEATQAKILTVMDTKEALQAENKETRPVGQIISVLLDSTKILHLSIALLLCAAFYE
jgi:hypothetical protein